MSTTATPQTLGFQTPEVNMVTILRMGDGSFRLYGLGKGPKVHMKPEMQAWTRQDEEHTGNHFYVSHNAVVAQQMADKHGTTIDSARLS